MRHERVGSNVHLAVVWTAAITLVLGLAPSATANSYLQGYSAGLLRTTVAFDESGEVLTVKDERKDGWGQIVRWQVAALGQAGACVNEKGFQKTVTCDLSFAEDLVITYWVDSKDGAAVVATSPSQTDIT